MTTLLATVLRGLRSRALLSAGSVLLTALAIGSALLGPVYQVAVTGSFLVTRLDDAANNQTGLSWRFEPAGGGGPEDALAAAETGAEEVDGPFTAATAVLETPRVDAIGGQAMLTSTADACDHLDVEGACPAAAGEVLLLAGDLEEQRIAIGDVLPMADYGPVTVVGGYRVPEDETDYWFDLARFASTPQQETRTVTLPFSPAPFVTVPATFAQFDAGSWSVRVDRRLAVPPDYDLDDLAAATDAAAGLDGSRTEVEGGVLLGESVNDLDTVVSETRAQQATARDSITPAVLSLVLVALALLLRLMTAAAELRLPELALASLRGVSRRRMWALGLTEPFVLLVLSVPVGAVLGGVLAVTLVRAWLVPGLPMPVPAAAVAAGLAVVVATLLVAVLAVGLVLRQSLAEQLTGVRRPRAAGRTAVIAQLVLAAGAVAVLVSKLSAGERADPDLTDLVLPVLLAVVAGIAAAQATTGGARWWTRARPRTRSLGGFVAARALSRRREGTLVILPVTAAIAIGVFGAGVYDAAAQWRASVAATAAPAQVIWTTTAPIDEAVALTHEIDPEGRYLMAASTVVTLGPTYVVVDTPRLSQVATWSPQWTPGTSTDEIADLLAPSGTLPTFTGTSLGLEVANAATTSDDLVIRLRLSSGERRSHDVYLGPIAPGTSRPVADVAFCETGCTIEGLAVGGPASLQMTMTGSVTLSDFTVDEQPLVGAVAGAGWGEAPTTGYPDALGGLVDDGGSLRIDLAADEPGVVELTTGGLPVALPVVKGVDARTTVAPDSLADTNAVEFPIEPVLVSASTPLLGPVGLMVDYRMLTADRNLYDQGTQVYVLGRADTPPELTTALQDRGLSIDTTYDEVRRGLDQSAYALALRLYAVVALLVLVMALAGLVVSTAVQLPSRRRDAASLRVVGVPRRAVVSAVLRELAIVLGGTAVAGLAAGTLAQYVVLRTVTLGYVEALDTPALTATVGWGRLVLLAVVAAVVLGLVALVSAILTVRGARGATLRESAR
jgi:hypothetical protein